jgi:hypothetical protein
MAIQFFWWRHPDTKQMYSDQRQEGYEDLPYIKDGLKCELIRDYEPPEQEERDGHIAIIDKNREVFQADREYVKSMKPKYVKFQDGHSEIYDPCKHN